MTYGEMRDFVLQLLNQYSVAGSQVPLSYNNQADDVTRIPALTRDGLYYVTTTAKKLPAVLELDDPEPVGNMNAYTLPDDFFQMKSGGILQVDRSGRVSRCGRFRLLGGRQLLLPAEPGTRYRLEYYRYPWTPEGLPQDGDFLDCPPEAQTAVAYYVAAHLAMEDSSFLYGALYSDFELKMARLQEGPVAECTVAEDVYGLCG